MPKCKYTQEELDAAVTVLALGVWRNGESKTIADRVCVLPEDNGHRTSYRAACEVLFRKWKITHYDRRWESYGTVIELRLYTAPMFGAVADSELKLVKTFLVECTGSAGGKVSELTHPKKKRSTRDKGGGVEDSGG